MSSLRHLPFALSCQGMHRIPHGIRVSSSTCRWGGLVCLLWGSAYAASLSETEALRMQVQPAVFEKTEDAEESHIRAAENVINIAEGGLMPTAPEAFDVEYENGSMRYDHEANAVIYEGCGNPIHVITDKGSEMFADQVTAHLERKTLELSGNVTAFQGESVTRAPYIEYHWETRELAVGKIRTKVSGMILEADSFEYGTDARGNRYVKTRRASLTTEDKKKPSSWLVADTLNIYPEDRLEFSHMWVQVGNVPVFYFPWFVHSLNPREGYMLRPGTQSTWGAYLLNEYGILLGNRRIEHGVPTSDYLATLRLDYRTRRGMAYGIDAEETALAKKYRNLDGLSVYYADDTGPDINPTETLRVPVGKNRSRIALHQMWDLPIDDPVHAVYALKTNINYLSDRYVLRDFFHELCQTNDKPDNAVTLDRRTKESQTTLLVRHDLNDFYLTEDRTELSYDRVRSALFDTRLTYETHNSFGVLKQNLSPSERVSIQNTIDSLRGDEVETREYWQRMLNTGAYMRFYSLHELTTSYKVAGFLNITPKAGGGYMGYYDVDNVGNDNRFLAYAACDVDMKFSRSYSSARNYTFGVNGLNHVIQPYSTFSVGEATDAKPLVPRIDAWTSTTNPMPLDISSLACVDTFSEWAVWRYGVRNILSTDRNGGRIEWMSWNVFMDANIKAADTDREFSNLYSRWRWNPVQWYSLNSEMQFPVIHESQAYKEYNNYIQFQPIRSCEFSVGHRYLSGHSIFEDSNQLNLRCLFRITENVAMSGEWQWDLVEKRTQIQQYSLYRNVGALFVGSSVFVRNNGGKQELGVGFSITLGETRDSFPINFF